jgi:putative DNA primase/helicase
MNGSTQTDTRPPCPKPLPVIVENIPAELKQLNQWVTWKFEYRDRWTKPPYRVDGLSYAKANDPTTWGSFQQALATYKRGVVCGMGFEPTAELGLVLIDLDHCIDEAAKKIAPWAAEIVARFATYVERSPVDGVRIIAKGTLPRAGRKKGDVEIYSATHYLTLTGQKFKNKPATIEPCQEAIDWLLETYFKEPEKPKPQRSDNGAGHPSSVMNCSVRFVQQRTAGSLSGCSMMATPRSTAVMIARQIWPCVLCSRSGSPTRRSSTESFAVPA